MEILLIVDGSPSPESAIRYLPYFFSARLVGMNAVTAAAVEGVQAAVVELKDAVPENIAALKTAWPLLEGLPVICIASRACRLESVQAQAFGGAHIFERGRSVADLTRLVRDLASPNLLDALPEDTPASVAEAYVKANAVLEDLSLCVVLENNFPEGALRVATDRILTTLEADGLSSWLKAVQSHHSPTFAHSLMVAGFAGAFALRLGWSDADLRLMLAGGLAHDIGKAKIPLSILDKPGKLTDAERELVDRHPAYGEEILKLHQETPVGIKMLAIQHHEFLDGSGYPHGLKAEQIDTRVRALTICDIFAALTEVRPYRSSVPVRAAIAMLREMGPRLDQGLVSEFAGLVLKNDFGDLKSMASRRRAAVSARAAAARASRAQVSR